MACAASTRAGSDAQRSRPAVGPRTYDDAVNIRIHELSRQEVDAGKTHRNIAFTEAFLVGFDGDCAECLDADIHGAERFHITHRTKDQYTFPAVGDGFCRELVAEQRATERSAAIHHQHRATAILRDEFTHTGIVLMALDGDDAAGKGCARAKIPEQRIDHSHIVGKVVANIAGATRHGVAPGKRGRGRL